VGAYPRGSFHHKPRAQGRHQEATGALFTDLRTYLKGSPCRAFMAPLDVFLDEGDAATVVEQDVLAVCDPGKISNEGIHGSPDFVAEVLSESSTVRDLEIKKDLYERYGVREYWIVHPDTGTVFHYT